MTEMNLLEAMLANLPNFTGLILLSFSLWKNNQRLLDLLERELDECRERIKEPVLP